MLFNNAINTSVYFCYFCYTLRAKLESWEWKVLIISSQFYIPMKRSYINEQLLCTLLPLEGDKVWKTACAANNSNVLTFRHRASCI